MDMESVIKRFQTETSSKNIRAVEGVELLKSITEYPDNINSPDSNHYIEPVVVEYFVPKLGRFVHETKYLFIELYDPITEKQTHIQIHKKFKKLNQPIDIIEVMNQFPQYMINILEYYGELMSFHEKTSYEIQNGLKGNDESILRALYLTEVLKKKEPSLATFEILGDYIRYNINWYIRYLNNKRINFSLEDGTVLHLINICVAEKEKRDEELDDRFFTLRDIYLEQAFPFIDEEDDDDL